MEKEEEKRRYHQVPVPNEEIPQEEQQPVPSRECNNLPESLKDESSDEKEHNGTTSKIFKIL